MRLSALTFQQQFLRFDKQLRAHSDGQPFQSFREGLPADWEDYKADVRRTARRLLAFDKWKRADVGSGRILKRVIRAIEIHDSKSGLRNNLVAWQNRFGHAALPHRALLDAKSDVITRRNLEKWFLGFFTGRLTDAEAFESFCEQAGNRYDLVAYLFFLKDWAHFMPIAPKTFDEAFHLLGVELITNQHCSWENYDRYNSALLAVQRALRDVAGVADARLIDAHSFCWMLVRQKLPTAAPDVIIPLPKAVTNLKAFVPPRHSSSVEIEFEEVSEEEFIKRDTERRRLGNLAQEVALQSEQKRLIKAGHPNPEEAATPVWHEPKRGYDILSCELDGSPRHIEAKAARQSGHKLSFFLTPHELRQCRALPNYHFYLVLKTESSRPVVLAVESAQVANECLTPANYLASFHSLAARGLK